MKKLYFTLICIFLLSFSKESVGQLSQVSETTTQCIDFLINETQSSNEYINGVELAEDSTYTWRVLLSDAKKIKIQFEDQGFNVDDELKIFDGDTNTTPILHYPDGGIAPNATVYTNTGLTTIVYHNGSNNNNNSEFTIYTTGILNLTAQVINDNCFGAGKGAIDIEVSGSPDSYTWTGPSFSSNNQDISDLLEGTYDLSISNANGCELDTSFVISQPSELSISATKINDETCPSDNDGKVILSASGGTPGYNYTLGAIGPQASNQFAGLSAGDYSYSVKDQNGCEANSATDITIEQPDALSYIIDTSDYNGHNISCSGGNNGWIELTISGGAPPYSYLWSDGQTANKAIDLDVGNGPYSCTVKDANSCELLVPGVVLTEPATLLSASTVSIKHACYGEASAGVKISGTGGYGLPSNFNYQWSNGGTTDSIGNLSAGDYFFTITDSASCTYSDKITITQPANPISYNINSVSQYNGYNVLCKGNDTAYIDITATGGYSDSYGYSWSDGGTFSGTGKTITDLKAATYTVTITDDNSCTASFDFDIKEPPTNIAISNVSLSGYNGYEISCNGGNNGSIDLTLSGGVTPYTYSWNNGQTGKKAIGLTAGNYNVTVADANGCETNGGAYTLDEPDELSTSVVSKTEVSCKGESTGSITLSTTGGVGGYTYSWENTNNPGTEIGASNSLNSVAAGTYSVTIADNNLECELVKTYTITEPATVLDISLVDFSDYNGYGVSCLSTNNDGFIEVVGAGGAGNYVYQWNTDGSFDAANARNKDLSAGNYTVTVQDDNNCTANANYTLTKPPTSPNITQAELSAFNGFGVHCNGDSDGSVTLTMAGGVGTYNYLWDDASTQTSIKAVGLGSGNYNVTVTDANNCITYGGPYNITEPGVMTIQADLNNISFYENNDGYIHITTVDNALGSSTTWQYNWSGSLADGTGDAFKDKDNLTAGTYGVTVTGLNNCEVSELYELTQPAELIGGNIELSGGGASMVACAGVDTYEFVHKTATQGGSSPYTYQWQYKLVSGNWNNIASATSVDYDWTTTLPEDTYIRRITGDGSTTDTSNTIFLDLTTLSTTVAEDKAACFNEATGGEATVNVTGGTGPYFIDWPGSGSTELENSNTTIGNLDSINYTYTIQDTYCTVANNITIGNNPEITVTIDSSGFVGFDDFAVSCNGASDGWIEVTAAGGSDGFSYKWGTNTGSQTGGRAINLSAGNFQYTVTDANGCTYASSETIHQPDEMAIQSNLNHISVYGKNDGYIHITTVDNALGSSTTWQYNWSGSLTDGTGSSFTDKDNLLAGTYGVTVTDEFGCEVSSLYELTQPNKLTGGSIEVNGGKTETVCESNKPSPFTSTAPALEGDGNFTYSWQVSTDRAAWNTLAGETSLDLTWDNVLTEDYYVRRKVVDGAGAKAYSDTLFLDFIAKPTMKILGLATGYCSNADEVEIIGVPTDNYGSFSLNGISDNNDGTAFFDPALADTSGGNPITVTYLYNDQYGCSSSTSKTTEIYPKPEVTLDLPEKILKTDSIYDLASQPHSPAGGIYSGEWVFASDSSLFAHKLIDNEKYGITYSYTETVNNCKNSVTDSIIAAVGAGTINANDIYCIYDDPVTIDADPILFNHDQYAAFEAPIQNLSDPNSGLLDPALLGAGVHIIRFIYKGSEGNFEIEKEITIYDVSGEAKIENLNDKYCQYGQEVTIYSNSLGQDDEGVFLGPVGLTNYADSAILDINAMAVTPASSPHQVQFIYTHGESGCKDTTIRSVNVYDLPEVGFTIRDTFNVVESPTTIQNVTPPGGTFSGNGMSNTVFSPNIAGLGSHDIKYTYTESSTGCVNDSIKTVAVDTARGQFHNIDNFAIYCPNGARDTIWVSTENGLTGGTFSGQGVTNIAGDSAVIYPAQLPDTSTITYTYTGVDNQTTFELTTEIYKDVIGTLEISTPKSEFCIDDNQVQIKGLINSALANDGDFAGIGVSEGTENDGIATFSPASAGVGTHFIRYSYASTRANSSCRDTVITEFHVDTLPEISFDLPKLYNFDGPIDTLVTVPQGGNFTGSPGIVDSNNGYFDPSLTQINSPTITYEYTDENSCTSTRTSSTIVQVAQGTINDLDNSYCYTDLPTTVSAAPVNANTEFGRFIGHGIQDNGDNTALFNPQQAYDEIGLTDVEVFDTLYFEYKNNNGDDTVTFTLSKPYKLVNLGEIVMLLEDKVHCNNDTTFAIVAEPLGGIFTGTAVNGTPISGFTFNPTLANVGENVINYTYTDIALGCTISNNDTIEILGLPQLDFTLPAQFCSSDDPQVIVGSPRGDGYFEGPNLTLLGNKLDSVLFTPNNSIIGNQAIQYIFTDAQTQCTDTLQQNTIVDTLPEVSIDFTMPVQGYCHVDDVKQLQGEYNGSPAGTGIFSGNGVVDESLNTGQGGFNPILSGIGEHQVIFSYTDMNGCTNSTDINITVNALPSLTITGLTTDKEYCNNDNGEVTINGLPNTGTGYFNIENQAQVNDFSATFVPSEYVGDDYIGFTYSYTDENQCQNTLTDSVEVLVAPSPTFSSIPVQICSNGNSDTIVGYPRGGNLTSDLLLFEIEGATDSVSFTPGSNFVGNNSVFYEYTSANGCTETIEGIVRIDTIPDVAMDFDMPASGYCLINAAYEVSGLNNGLGVNTGIFSGSAIVNQALNTGKGAINPILTGADGEYPITFTYTDANGCTNSTSQNIVVNGLPELSVTGLNTAKSYCDNNSNSITINGLPNTGTGVFNIENQPLVNGSSAGFVPLNYLGDNYIAFSYNYTDENQCQNSYTDSIQVLNAPEPGFSMLSGQICANISSDTIVGYPRGGELSATLPLIEITGAIDSMRYAPSEDFVGANQIFYEYTAANGCTEIAESEITINAIPQVGIASNMPDNGYCHIDQEYQVTGLYNDAGTNTGIFTGSPIVDPNQNSGKGLVNPILSGIGDHLVYFTFTDNNGCVNSAEIEITVNPLPDIEIIGLSNNYCNNIEQTEVINGTPGAGSQNSFTVNGINFPGNSYEFVPVDYADKDSVIVVYTHTSNVGCVNSETRKVIINKAPDPEFTMSDICIADSIALIYEGDTPLDSIQQFTWDLFNDESLISNEVRPKLEYNLPENVEVKLTLLSKNNCESSLVKNWKLENNPNAGFSWKYECITDDGVLFTAEEEDTENYKYQWDFGDGASANSNTERHNFAETGAYQVNLTVSTQSANSTCKSTITDTVHVRPTFTISDTEDYTESFEEDHGGWVPENLDNSASFYTWEFGRPNSNRLIDTASNGVNIYATNLSGNYKIYENSAVTSPCFIFDESLTRPMISLDIFSQLVNGRDGAVLEYTTDAGDNWNLVGEQGQGIAWYNSADIQARPGNSSNKGWTDTISTWQTARHDLNKLMGDDTIRFRLAFASDDYAQYEGFAFDNIRIGNRTRRVLIEHFTNTEIAQAVSSDKTINSTVDYLPTDAIDIQYHTSVNANDPFYKSYPLGASSREAFYDISSIPSAIFDGSVKFDFSLNNKPDTIKLMQQALTDPLFAMDINSEEQGNTINVELNIQAKSPIVGRQLQLYTAIVEKEVVVNGKSAAFQNVLRRFLPNPGGKYISSTWEAQETLTESFSYNLDDYIGASDNITVISFIQDEITKEVLQTVTTDTTSTATSVVNWMAAQSRLNLLLYPNPARSECSILFSEPTQANAELIIHNQQGQVVERITLAENLMGKRIKTTEYGEGVYFVTWMQGNKRAYQKLIIIH